MSRSSQTTVVWWLGWITLTIASFFVSCAFWTWIIAGHVGPMDRAGAPLLWVTAVFGTWMVILLPLIVVMYRKVDQAYEDARIARERLQFDKARKVSGVRFVHVAEDRRLLPESVRRKLRGIPWTLRNGHLVTAHLAGGGRKENVFVLNRREIVGLHGRDAEPFDAATVIDVEPADPALLAGLESGDWLRLDGSEEPSAA